MSLARSCFPLFDAGIPPDQAAAELKLALTEVQAVFNDLWVPHSMKRAKAAIEADKEAVYARLKDSKLGT